MPLLSNATIKPAEYATRPFTTLLELLLIPALLLSNLPQYIHFILHGPGLTSPWYIILVLLFSTMQVASRIYAPQFNNRLLFVRDAGRCSHWIFSALLDYILIAIQWMCSCLLMIFFLATRANDLLPASLAIFVPGHLIPTYAIPLITILSSIVLFYSSCATLLTREIDPDEDLAGCWRQIFISCLSSYIYTLLNFTLSITHFIPQLLAILRTKSGSGLSIISIGLQIPTLFLLALVAGRRFDQDFKKERGRNPEVDERIPEVSAQSCVWRKKFRSNLKREAIWYLCGGNVAVGYGVMAAGQAALLGLCLRHRTTDEVTIRESFSSAIERWKVCFRDE
ncbi:hypothetical protein N431DRAFT_475466 [Stipitochalara longipes BDJ]|nr:hypothetical protein N431DRAFT_475466 [Stipitochalara longipes BDJ]